MKPGLVKLQVFPDTCQGCRACEAQCSTFHYGEVNPFATGIKIVESAKPGYFKQVVCEQCIDMPCAEVCPEEAIVRNSYSGAVEITDKCQLCGNCAMACPIGAIIMPTVSWITKAIKCDLCGGSPTCVAVCPRHSLGW